MNKVSLLIMCLLTLLFQSCGDKKVIKTETEIITVQSAESSKDELIKLVEPIEIDSIKNSIFVSYPLSIQRIDMGESKINLDYLTNKAVNYEKINPIKRDFKKYFEKSFPDTILSNHGGLSPSFEEYLSLPNVFVYSGKPRGNLTLGNKKVYSDVIEMRTDVALYLAKNKGKIIIIYNPLIKKSSDTSCADCPPPACKDCPALYSEIAAALKRIADEKSLPSDRLKLASDTYAKYFDLHCAVKNYDPEINGYDMQYTSADAYLNHLAAVVNLKGIEVRSVDLSNEGKVVKIVVQENIAR